MSLAAGSRLGAYEIVSLLGSGGMGEVYRARDTRLKRDVAIKVLRPEVAHDLDRLARFEREAQILAQLSHPNIAAIYGVEQAGATTALVLEFIDGPTLADRIALGPVPLDEVLPIARQIADALEAAHEQGIIHRDLKPANIKVREDGTVKVLDFGLAKALDPAPGSGLAASALTNSPTLTSPALMTGVGVLLGTAAYMSPEQAKGRPADKRSDIWAFGCVLYEMLTGRRPFGGEDVADALAAVLRAEPQWNLLPADLPSSVRRVLRRCLVRDPRKRLGNAGAVVLEFDDAGDHESMAALTVGGETPRRAWLLGALAGVAALSGWVGFLIAPRSGTGGERPGPPVQFEVNAPGSNNAAAFAISPDGTRLVYVGRDGGALRLYLRNLERAEATPLAGTDNADNPFWSPDGKSVAFFADEKLKRVEVAGGLPRVLANATSGNGGTWGADGTILFGLNGTSSEIARVSQEGGEAKAVTTREGGPGHVAPELLPDGRHFLYFVVASTGTHGRVMIGSLGGDPPIDLIDATGSAVFVPSGHLVFTREGTLFRQAFDATALRLVGQPVPVVASVALGRFGRSAVSVSKTGVVGYRAARDGTAFSERRQLRWVGRSGNDLGSASDADEASLVGPRLSHDGRRIAVSRSGGGKNDVWLLDATRRGPFVRLTFEGSNQSPVWSPDDRRIAYRSNRGERLNLYGKASDGTGPESLIFASAQDNIPLDWSRDGRTLIFRVNARSTGRDLWALPMDPPGEPYPVVATEASEPNGTLSPHGQWLAFESNVSGRYEVYLQVFRADGKWQVSTAGGEAAQWRADGKELFFLAADGAMMAVDIGRTADGKAPVLGTPKKLFDAPIVKVLAREPQYAVSPDGQRFLLNVVDETAPPPPITVTVNWNPDRK